LAASTRRPVLEGTRTRGMIEPVRGWVEENMVRAQEKRGEQEWYCCVEEAEPE